MSVRKEFVKLQTSVYTGSNARTLEKDGDGNIKGVIELRLPDNISSATDATKIELQVNKMSLSLFNVPVAFVPVDPVAMVAAIEENKPIPTKLWIGLWPYYVLDDKSIKPTGPIDDSSYNFPKTPVVGVSIPLTFETFDIDYAKRTGNLPIKRFDTLAYALETALSDAYSLLQSTDYPVTRKCAEFEVDVSSDTFKLTLRPIQFYNSANMYLFGTPGMFLNTITGAYLSNGSYGTFRRVLDISTNAEMFVPPQKSALGRAQNVPWGINIVVNEALQKILNFLPWISPVRYNKLNDYQKFEFYNGAAIGDKDFFYVLNSVSSKVETFWPNEWSMVNFIASPQYAYKFANATYTWTNVPTILMTPVSSIVLLMDGMGVTPQVMPVNIQQSQGSSLTTSIPVIENYFPLAASVRDLHDTLLVTREAFTNTPLFAVTPNSMTERTLRFRAGYVTKDGQLFDLYIPPTGTFSINLVLCVTHDTQEERARKVPRIN